MADIRDYRDSDDVVPVATPVEPQMVVDVEHRLPREPRERGDFDPDDDFPDWGKGED